MHIKRPFENGRSNSKGLFHIYVRVDMGEGLPQNSRFFGKMQIISTISIFLIFISKTM